MLKKSSFAIALAVCLTACAGSKSRLKVGESSQGEVVEAEGFAPNNPADQIQTKRASLVDAQRNAVEKAVGVFVSGRTLVEKAVAIENNILAKSDGYIKKYDILSEGLQQDLYRTKIRALVAVKNLQEDLKDMALLNQPELKRPRVSVSVTEQVDRVETTEKVAERELESRLTNAGFVVVADDRSKEAELNIKGQASAFPFQSSGLGGFVSYRARMSLQAMRPGTSDVLVSMTKEASGLGGNAQLAGFKALETVADVAGDELAGSLTQAWSKNQSLLVYVEGIKSFGDVEKVRKHLASQPGVNDLMLRLYDTEMTQFEVQLNGIPSSELASSLEASHTLPLKVLETKPQLMRLRLE